MATNAQIFEMRLSLKEPNGFNTIVESANISALPVSPIAQTLYYVIDINEYREHESGEWERQDVEMSNERMGIFIDLYGMTKAKLYIIKELVRSLGQKLYTAQYSNGSESTVFQNLTTMRNYYKDLMDDLKEDIAEESGSSTGFYASTKKPNIGGMDL
jgi:hypothetical protein